MTEHDETTQAVLKAIDDGQLQERAQTPAQRVQQQRDRERTKREADAAQAKLLKAQAESKRKK